MRAPVRGRLLISATGDPLDEVLRLRLRTGDVTQVEDLITAPDGTFVTTSEFPRGLLLLKVFRPNGEQAADLEGAFDPAAPEEWVVRVPWPTFVHGTVLDRAGQSLPRVEVALVPRRAGAPILEGRTRHGEFSLQGLQPGSYTLHLWIGLEGHALELDVRRGPNELGELRIPFGETSGEVRGRLVAHDGAPEARVLLLSQPEDLVAAVEAEADPTRPDTSTFLFRNVPAGRHRLEILACDGRRYEPQGLAVEPNAAELEFLATGREERFQLRVVVDGETEQACGLVRLHGQWFLDHGGFARADVERWVALYPGRRPATGERPVGAEIRVEPGAGHGQAFLFAEAGRDTAWANGGGVRGRMLAGVEVLVDGRTVATSDAAGLALVDLAQAPGEVAFRLPGWQVVEVIESWLVGSVALARE
jgi:hypothetical protein